MAGLRIGVVTDSGGFYPHDDPSEELRLLVERNGFTPERALLAATRVNAELLDVADETGTLEVGKSADLIVVDGNPLQDVTAIRHLHRVVACGRVYVPGP